MHRRLENLDLEMKKLEKQGIELNIEKANREITKLKNTKPSSDNGNEDPGLDIPEDPGEEPEDPSIEPEEPAEAYQELTAEAEPYMGEGTVEEPTFSVLLTVILAFSLSTKSLTIANPSPVPFFSLSGDEE